MILVVLAEVLIAVVATIVTQCPASFIVPGIFCPTGYSHFTVGATEARSGCQGHTGITQHSQDSSSGLA